MRFHAFLSILSVSLLLLTFCSAVPAHAASSWNVQTVDDGYGYGNGHCPIVIDSNNTPHIAYTDFYLDDERHHIPLVMYATWNGSSWNNQTIDFGDARSLVLDANSNPQVLYRVHESKIRYEGFMYAIWTGSNWTIQTVDVNGAGYVSAALDSSGKPHVAYIDGQVLKYASWTGSSWSIQTALASSNLTSFGNMVLDSKGYPHFIYVLRHRFENGSVSETLMYASWHGFALKTETVVSNAPLHSIGSLALDSNDYPHFVYITPYNATAPEQLMYVRWTGTAWESQTVDTNIIPQGPCYLVLDSNGNPHISYRGYPLGGPHGGLRAHIMYATANATEPTQPTSPTFPALPLLLVLTVVIILAVVTVVYVWKKKTQKP